MAKGMLSDSNRILSESNFEKKKKKTVNYILLINESLLIKSE